MDDVLLIYANGSHWDAQRFCADFVRSTCYHPPLALVDGHENMCGTLWNERLLRHAQQAGLVLTHNSQALLRSALHGHAVITAGCRSVGICTEILE